MKIYKYPLELADRGVVAMPAGSKILTVQTQHNVICLWAEVEPDGVPEQRTFAVIGTGHADIPPANRDYIGTVQQFDGSLVWHVYEVY